MNTSASGQPLAVLAHGRLLIAALLGAIFVAFLAPPAAFSIDDVLYIDMAHAMADRGALDVTGDSSVPDAPTLSKSNGIVHVINGKAIPQYPSGYAFFAAPFMKLFGVSGLILMNAIAAVLSLGLTYLIALRLEAPSNVARNAVIILGAVTIFSGYAVAIWPHMSALAFILGGALFTLKTNSGEGRRRLLYAVIAGLLFGLSLNFRIDGIFLAAAAFFWLRFFGAPGDRLAALALAVGIVPNLLFAAYLNELKFGVFLPLYYGHKEGLASTTAYTPLAIAGLAALAVSLLVDVSRPYFQRLLAIPMKFKLIALAIICAAAFVIAGDLIIRVVTGAYVLLFDIQAYDGGRAQMGLFRDQYGYWSFWGLPKKALLQSLPFAALAIIPIVEFFRGKNTSMHAFSLMMIAAPICFFSINSFQGGMTYNMRYFLPCVPFMAILAAQALLHLAPTLQAHPKLMFRGGLAGGFVALVFYFLLPVQSAPLATPLQLYPQLALFIALALCLIAYLAKRRERIMAVSAIGLAGAAFGYAGLLGFADLAGYLSIRSAKMPYERAYETALPPGSLVLSMAEDYLVHASLNGVTVVRAAPDRQADAEAAMTAYRAAGRCVYVHTRAAMSIFDGAGFEPVAVPGIASDSELVLFAPADQPQPCRFSGA